MKKVILSLATVMLSSSSYATSDAFDRVFVVVRDLSVGEYFLERVPVIGCYGHPLGARTIQFTAKYKVPANVGCGEEATTANINALTCAKVVSTEDSERFDSYTEMVMDITKCKDKDDSQFVSMIRTAARLNFATKNGDLVLKLVR